MWYDMIQYDNIFGIMWYSVARYIDMIEYDRYNVMYDLTFYCMVFNQRHEPFFEYVICYDRL